MKNEIKPSHEHSPSAAEMDDYIKSLNGNIKIKGLEGNGWHYTGTSNTDGSN